MKNHMKNPMNHPMSHRGSVYIMVLVTSAFVLATGLAALSLEQRVHERSDVTARVGAARVAVRTGLDLAVQSMAEDPSWRTSVAVGGLYLTRDIDTGDSVHTVRVYATDADGVIDDGDLDPFTLRVVASQTDTRRALQVSLQPTLVPVDVLEFGAYTTGQVITGTSSAVNGDAGIAAAGDFVGNGSLFFVPVETERTVDAATYTSTVTENAPAREFPPDGAIGAIYSPYGTSVSMSDLKLTSGVYVIENVAVGPGRNPFGLLGILSPDNVYVFDHGSRDIIVRNSRIAATFVFVGSGQVILEGSVSWAPATPGWPAIITDDSDLVFRLSSNSLSESVHATNFNPIGFGAGGTEDLDQADFYTSQISGIVYTRNKAVVETGSTRIVGSLICGNDLTINSSAILDLRASPDSLGSPPIGFRSVYSPRMVVSGWLDP
ncbi:MAG: hypothetical protein ACI89L_000223 [Phycisphaerales bacterium]|jgi:hypothetical protein